MRMNAAGPHHTVHGITDLYKRYTQTIRTRKQQGGKNIQTVFIYFFFSLSLSLFTRVFSSHVTDLDLRLAAGGRADHYNRRKQKAKNENKKKHMKRIRRLFLRVRSCTS
jgi:hypothetical protein